MELSAFEWIILIAYAGFGIWLFHQFFTVISFNSTKLFVFEIFLGICFTAICIHFWWIAAIILAIFGIVGIVSKRIPLAAVSIFLAIITVIIGISNRDTSKPRPTTSSSSSSSSSSTDSLTDTTQETTVSSDNSSVSSTDQTVESAEGPDYLGRYNLVMIEIGPLVMTPDMYGYEDCYMELKNDGNLIFFDGEDAETEPYTVDGTAFSMEENGNILKGTIQNNTVELILTAEDIGRESDAKAMTMYFALEGSAVATKLQNEAVSAGSVNEQLENLSKDDLIKLKDHFGYLFDSDSLNTDSGASSTSNLNPAAVEISGRPNLDGEPSLQRIKVIDANASSTIDQSNIKVENDAMFMFDGDDVTSWQEGVPGYGAGEWVDFTLDSNYEVKYIGLKLGNWRSDKWYTQNGKPKTMTLVVGESVFDVSFQNEKIEQWIRIDETSPTQSLSLILGEAYPGTVYEDTCIAEVELYGVKNG